MYSLQIARIDSMDHAAHLACCDLEAKARRSLASTLKDAKRACKRYGTYAAIYDTQGWLVLRVDADGHRAP